MGNNRIIWKIAKLNRLRYKLKTSGVAPLIEMAKLHQSIHILKEEIKMMRHPMSR
jgi:hypothetical protein